MYNDFDVEKVEHQQKWRTNHVSSLQNPSWLFDVEDELLPNYIVIIWKASI